MEPLTIQCPACQKEVMVVEMRERIPCPHCAYEIPRDEVVRLLAKQVAVIAPQQPALSPAASQAALAQPVPAPRRSAMTIPCLGVCVVLIVLALIPVFLILKFTAVVRETGTNAVAVSQEIAQAFKPQQDFNTVIASTLADVKKQGKLVVFQGEVDAFLSKEDAIEWLGLPLGTSAATVRAPGNKVQYFLPLDEVENIECRYDAARRELVVTFPPPRLDEQFVDLQENLEIQSERGWARLPSSTEPLKEEAIRELRSQVLLEAGANAAFNDMSRLYGREAIAGLLEKVVDSLDPGVTLEIVYRDEDPNRG